MSDREAPDILSTWARRKQAVQAEQQAEQGEQAKLADAARQEKDGPIADPGEPELSEAEILEDLSLPDPDSLQAGDDFSAFMDGSVPKYLKNRALRRLWLTNPLIAHVDGLVDYGEDYTDAAMVPKVLKTAYTVGRGFIRDVLEEKDPENLEALETAEITDPPGDAIAEQETVSQTDANGEDGSADMSEPATDDKSPDAGAIDTVAPMDGMETPPAEPDSNDEAVEFRPRRMAFQID